MGEARRGGIIMRVDGALVFISAGVAVKLAPIPQIARVPGAAEELLGIALHEGEILPVVALGGKREAMVVCTYLGESVGLVGGEGAQTGMFDVDSSETVTLAGEAARPLDIAAIYARLKGGGWVGRWGG